MYHINSKGEVRKCNASKRACQFGSDSHYDLESDAVRNAERILERQNNDLLKGLKKKKLPKYFIFGESDIDDLSFEERANVHIFEALKNLPDFKVGVSGVNDYYGTGSDAYVDPETMNTIKVMGFVPRVKKASYFTNKNLYVRELTEQGFTLHYVLGTLTSKETSHFTDTFSPSTSQEHLIARGILVSPDNKNKVEVELEMMGSFDEILFEALLQTKDFETYKAMNEVRFRRASHS